MAKYETVQAAHNSKHKQTQFASDDNVWNCTGNSKHTKANTNKSSLQMMTKYETVLFAEHTTANTNKTQFAIKYGTVQSTANHQIQLVRKGRV